MSDLATLSQRLDALQARLQRFEDAEAIRACVLRYMALCDRLDASTPLDALGDCFTADAVWAGKGARYGAAFGGHQGRAAIVAMLARYCGDAERPPHFRFNAHFLCNEQITPTGPDRAQAQWQMVQTSSFSAGGAHLNAAQLTLQMRRGADGAWRIAHFETENLLSRPVSTWHADAALPVPAR
ncbi:nuclear transport factor 2 family protein [Ideonella livida]|uniref:Nuclear transport factor 2 family protein n=1 Tax=Ideonella livida TaxID=2707176 RepID=A0A7C9TLN9_9BURK|nr:nuclear transport factor 2 family protein [Ideonella livida]NDY93680.1 nuclear transport factor 2 family protein [Ideonella livida]